ncbi:UDP-glucuronic acid decarboxylase 4 [Camellia lanceoleosa]|uniref:UDP-glucuronic acid decarboxylase 4 n=1 Tax=Camellia lanceoleosa TaxID=1840588 RepID=A0ACC0IGC3_9ERIC|nr:UDP-glucuronic acid decarboxylase 4 [Camellia lanceoleosa]
MAANNSPSALEKEQITKPLSFFFLEITKWKNNNILLLLLLTNTVGLRWDSSGKRREKVELPENAWGAKRVYAVDASEIAEQLQLPLLHEPLHTPLLQFPRQPYTAVMEPDVSVETNCMIRIAVLPIGPIPRCSFATTRSSSPRSVPSTSSTRRAPSRTNPGTPAAFGSSSWSVDRRRVCGRTSSPVSVSDRESVSNPYLGFKNYGVGKAVGRIPMGVGRRRLRIVVTGGAGSAGSPLVDRLIARGEMEQGGTDKLQDSHKPLHTWLNAILLRCTSSVSDRQFLQVSMAANNSPSALEKEQGCGGMVRERGESKWNYLKMLGVFAAIALVLLLLFILCMRLGFRSNLVFSED